jgi:hypothetical protein
MDGIVINVSARRGDQAPTHKPVPHSREVAYAAIVWHTESCYCWRHVAGSAGVAPGVNGWSSFGEGS